MTRAGSGARVVRSVFAVAIVLIVAGCAHYPVNERLEHFDPDYGYRFTNLSSADNSDELLMILTFSGGGTRAAALAYGVLEELSKLHIGRPGRQRRLLDEVDIISSVSGGSYTAAYYALYRDRTFEDFQSAFLEHDVQGEIIRTILAPWNLARASGPTFGRIDVVAEYLDKQLFHGSTFGDLVAAGKRPLVLINASDLSLGARFEFTQEQFDRLCSDLSQVPLARAVAASSAVPVVLSPVVIRNYSGQCGYLEPTWVQAALRNPTASMRRFYKASEVRSYLDSDARPYIHLVDGGITDNIGLRGLLDRVIPLDGAQHLMQSLGVPNVRRAVLIMVNAETAPDFSRDRSEAVPTVSEVVRAIKDVPINRYSFETRELLEANFEAWASQIREHQPASDSSSFEFYLVDVNFDAIHDPAERERFMSIPTSFHLPAQAVAVLRKLARQLLAESAQFRRLLNDLGVEPQAVETTDSGHP